MPAYEAVRHKRQVPFSASAASNLERSGAVEGLKVRTCTCNIPIFSPVIKWLNRGCS